MSVRRRDLLCGETIHDARDDCGELRLRATSANHEGFGNRGDPGNVKNDDVRRLLIFGEEGNLPRKIVGLNAALFLNHQLSLPESSRCWINRDVIRLNRSLEDEFWSIKVETALLDVVGYGARNEVAKRAPTRRKRTEFTARV
jgi:hypothetical protein